MSRIDYEYYRLISESDVEHYSVYIKTDPYDRFRKNLARFFRLAKWYGPVYAAAECFSKLDAQILAILIYRRVVNGIVISSRRHNYRPISYDEKKQIVQLYKQGHSIYYIAKTLNRHFSSVFYVLKQFGLK